MELNVTAFDIYNREFDEDQYKFMDFSTEIESLGIKKARDLTIDGVLGDNR